jgi:predicted metal-dependent hydrolase
VGVPARQAKFEMVRDAEISPVDLPAALKQAIETFNRGDYFAASEQFESFGYTADEELKNMVGALHRIAAGLHLRFARGGRQATINLLSHAMMSLDELRPSHAGIDVERLYNELAAFTDEIRASPREYEAGALRHKTRLFVERRRAPKVVLMRA